MLASSRLAVIGRHLAPASAQPLLRRADVCGIVGFVGRVPAFNFLHEGLTILQSRGYDSAGITTLGPDSQMITTKFASRATTSDALDLLRAHANDHGGHSTGIAHTRWATHGGKTDINAHPHHDAKDRIALVHNGVIQNSRELKEELERNHHIQFRSETDTEVVAQLVGLYISDGLDLAAAVTKATSRLDGTWGLAVVDRLHPDMIVVARNGSPMLIGIAQDAMYVASEASAFSQHTKEYISLENGEVAVVRAGQHTLDLRRVERASDETIRTSPDPWPHWTLREIMEQPEALSRALNYGGRLDSDTTVKLGGLDNNRDQLLSVQHLVIGACGTSLHAAEYGARIFRSLRCLHTVQPVDAAEILRETFPPSGGGFLCLSQSGETKDVCRALDAALECGLPAVSIVNAVGSQIARQTKCGIYLNAGREVAVASTKAFTSTVVCVCLMALWYAQQRRLEGAHRRRLVESLHRLPINAGMTLQRVRTLCNDVAARLADAQHMFVLGKGYGEPIAREGALKIKEVSYIHAEGYGGGSLKHGPFALIETGTPIIMLVLDDVHKQMMATALHEVKARGAFTVAITDCPDVVGHGLADVIIPIPSNGELTALLAVLPLQLIAYELALRRGNNPDKPRSLAKSVTVD